VLFVIKRNLWSIFLSGTILQNWFGKLYTSLNIPSPTNIKNLFGNCLNGIAITTKAQIRVVVCAIIWEIWNCRNNVVFNNANCAQLLQAIHKATHQINLWSFLLPEDIWILDALA
jgi:hypothetical protein